MEITTTMDRIKSAIRLDFLQVGGLSVIGSTLRANDRIRKVEKSEQPFC